MANNPYVNKVQKADGTTILDISDTTALASDVAQGKYFYLATGEKVQGTNAGGSGDGYVWQDGNGYVHLSDEQGTQTIIDALTVSSSGTTTAPTGHAYSPVTVPSGTAGTPTATKGTVSSHSVTVTPSVTNTTGWITGSTINGTGVSVSASELVSGTKSISSNGTNIDVTNYAAVDVAVPTGSATLTTKTITQNGTYNASSDNADGYSQVTVSVSGGGGGGGNITDPVRFFDYDGTLIASYTTVPSSLPSVPTHTGLTNGTWNYTLQQITTQFNATGMCDIGANFETSSGDTEIDIVLPAGRLSPRLRLAPNGTVTISWGDGTTSTVTGSSLTTTVDTQHNYASAGSYTISIHVNSGSYAFYSGGTYWLLNKGATTADANKVYSNCVKSVRVGNNANISSYAFAWCLSLESVSIPSSISSLGTYAFFNCYSLNFVAIPSTVATVSSYLMRYCYAMDAVSIPSGVTSIGDYAFSDCCSLERVSIPSGVTSIGTYAFYYNYALTSMNIPSGVTSITSQVLRNCYSLAMLTIPSDVTSIAGNAFTGCYGMSEYHIKPTTPPTLTSGAFNNIQSDCIMYVPSASLDTYKGAQSWSTYASYMVGE